MLHIAHFMLHVQTEATQSLWHSHIHRTVTGFQVNILQELGATPPPVAGAKPWTKVLSWLCRCCAVFMQTTNWAILEQLSLYLSRSLQASRHQMNGFTNCRSVGSQGSQLLEGYSQSLNLDISQARGKLFPYHQLREEGTPKYSDIGHPA